MTLTTGDERFVHVPLFETYAAQISDEMPEPKWSDPIGWSAALRQAADLVSPDLIAVSSREALAQDIEAATVGPIADADLADIIGEATDAFVETVNITADVRDEPLFSVVPDPVTLCVECFDDEWLDLLDADEFAALDVLHEVSQSLTDLVRAHGGTVEGIVLDYRGLEAAHEHGLRFDDALLEAGAVFNVADHHDLTIVGRLPQNLQDSADHFEEDVDALVFNVVPHDGLSSLEAVAVQTGGGFPDSFWNLDESTFRDELVAYLDALPDSYILIPSLPAAVEPERVQLYREVVTSQ
jgi:hypothetical protein